MRFPLMRRDSKRARAMGRLFTDSELECFIGTLPKPGNVVLPSDGQKAEAKPFSDVFGLIAAVTEWRDARQAALDIAGRPTTAEGRQERMEIWGRYSKAEDALMKVARKLGGDAVIRERGERRA